MIELQLPMPPSANRLWRRAGTRVHKSAEYASWLIQAGIVARSQFKGEPIKGPYRIYLNVSRPDKRRRDLDNRLKPVSDLLTSVGFIRDDSDCVKIVAEWVETGSGVSVRLEAA